MTMTLAATSVIPVSKYNCAYLVQYQVQRRLHHARVSLGRAAQRNVFTFPWISSREEASLRILIVLIIQSFSKAEAENLEIGVGVAHGDTVCLVGLHGIQYHGCLSCPLYKSKCR